MTTTMTKREDSAALNGEEYHLSFAEKDDDDAGEGPKVTGSYLDSLAGSGPPSYEFYSDTYGDAGGDVADPYRGVPSNPLGGYQPPGLVRQDQQETYVNGSSPSDSFVGGNAKAEEKKKEAPRAPSHDSFASFVSAGATSEEKDPNNNIPSFDSFAGSPKSVATAAESAEQEEKKDVPRAPSDDSFASFVSRGANSEEKDPNNFSSFDGFVGSGSLKSEESKAEDAPVQGKETFAHEESHSTFVAPADQHYHAPPSETVIDLVIEEEEQEQDIREVPPLETYVTESSGSDEAKGTGATPFEDGPAAEILGAGAEVEETGREPSFDGILSTVARIDEDDAGMIANGDGRAEILGAVVGGDRPNGDSSFGGGLLSAGVKYGDEAKEKERDAPHYLYDGSSSGIFGGGATFEKDDAGENVAADGEREDQGGSVGESAGARSENDDAKSEGRDPDSVPWFDRANPSDSDKSEETKHDGESSSRWYD